MNGKIEKPKELTDAEAEAFIRYLTKIEKPQKKTLVEVLLETPFGKSLIEEFIKLKKGKWQQGKP